MAQIREFATIRQANEAPKPTESPLQTRPLGVVDENGWPKAVNSALSINLRLIWERAKAEVERSTHHRLTLNQALALSERPIEFDANVPLDQYRHHVGVVGQVSMTQIQNSIWPNLPANTGDYRSLTEEQRRAYGIRQRLGSNIKRTLLAICISSGNRDQTSTWWIRDEAPERIPIPARYSRDTHRRTGDENEEPGLDEEPQGTSDKPSGELTAPSGGVPPHRSVPETPSAADNAAILLANPAALGAAIVDLAERALAVEMLEADNTRLAKLVEEQRCELERLSKVQDLINLMKDEV